LLPEIYILRNISVADRKTGKKERKKNREGEMMERETESKE
jgi:hypothetical protein